MNKDRAVLISDIHFNINTLPLAYESLKSALEKAKELSVPLIIAGDLLDQKSIIRAECANSIIKLLKDYTSVPTITLVGNHDLLNERSNEHSLNFLKPYTLLIDTPTFNKNLDLWLIPYQPSVSALQDTLKHIPPESTIIMHQGLTSADMGHYVQDKSAITTEDVKNYRVISGHYHKRQDIKCGRPRKNAIGLFSYIGNPYTVNFAEANDPTKGFQVLQSNGILRHHPCNLRRHIKMILQADNISIDVSQIRAVDLLWVVIEGDHDKLAHIDKKELGERLFNRIDFKLDLVPTKVLNNINNNDSVSTTTVDELFDQLIDTYPVSDEYKIALKDEWRTLIQ